LALYEFEGKRPRIGKDSFVHPQAVVIGDVELGDNCYVGAGAVVRGDYGRIVIGNGTNIQENCVIHAEPETICLIEDNVLIGHAAIVHGPCLVQHGVTVGMGSIVSTGCELEAESLLGSGSVLPPRQTIPSRKLAMGNPARVVKDLGENHIIYNQIGVKLYQDLAIRCQIGLKLIDD